MKRLLALLAVMTVFISTALAQRSASGYIYSVSDDQPVIGATVLVKGTSIGTSTDLEGNFVINNIPATATKLVISYVGMHSQETAIGQDLRIGLQSDSHQLDDVIVVAYGTAKKSEYTGSASVVKADQIQDALTSSVTSVLSGKVSGVQTFSADGHPGSAPKLRIRGVGSINASSNPLIVLDGVPFEGAISDISPSDVESMTVLKDAAANSLYGARAANGVVMITTKRGSAGNARVTVDARWGANDRAISNYNVLYSTDQYYELMYEGIYNQNMGLASYKGNPVRAWQAAATQVLQKATGYQIYTVPVGEFLIGRNGKINPNATLGYSDGTYYYTPDDWTKNSIHNGLRQDYTVSVSGGSDKLKYYISGSFLNDTGIIKNSDFNRLSTRTSVDWQAKPWLKIGTTLNYTYTKSNMPGDMDLDYATSSGNVFYLANHIAPVYPMFVREADGSVMMDEVYNLPVYDYGDRYSTKFKRNWMSLANPVGSLYYNKDQYMSDIFDGKWYININPISDLTITGNAGYWVSNDRAHLMGNPFYGQSANSDGWAEQAFTRTYSINLQALANYNHTFGDVHNMDLMVGYESYHMEREEGYAYGENLYDPDGWWVSNTIDNKIGSGSLPISYTTRGIFGRAKYNYDLKYFVQASYRRDASSRFAPEHRWGNFFSVSGAWDIAKENFMQDISFVDQLKFKVSFGQNGNDNLWNGSGNSSYYYYAWQDQYQATGANGVWTDATLVFKGNRDITWETSNNFNVGFDFSFFNGKLDGTIEYYQRQVSDMLFFLPTATSLGYASKPVNVGSMRNNGIELELNYNIINTKDINWSINGNITTLGNKITKLPAELIKDGQWISGVSIFAEGESRYQLYLPHYAGVNPENGMAMYTAKFTDAFYEDHPELKAAGIGQEFNTGMDYKDADGNVIIGANYANWSDVYNGNEEDKGLAVNRKKSGSLLPKAYGGFGTTLSAYGIDFSMTFAYQFGGKILDYTYQDLMHNASSSNNGINYHADILNRWTTPGQVTDVPRINAADQYSDSTSDRWFISSNFLSLNNITLGYTLPAKWTKSIGLESVRIYGAAENVALWAKRRGLDPRQGYATSDNSTYSPIRSFAGGIRIQF
ncbi:MAG: TonB-dependent receptor [Muribaculaceae bacterium]|nr:TonB-dependent receptor [Muribaculaceae bacterium]